MKDEKAILHRGLDMIQQSHASRLATLEEYDYQTSVNLLEKEAHKTFLSKINDCRKIIDEIPEVGEVRRVENFGFRHICNNMESVYSKDKQWIASDLSNNTIEGIKFCPFCGKKLEI